VDRLSGLWLNSDVGASTLARRTPRALFSDREKPLSDESFSSEPIVIVLRAFSPRGHLPPVLQTASTRGLEKSHVRRSHRPHRHHRPAIRLGTICELYLPTVQSLFGPVTRRKADSQWPENQEYRGSPALRIPVSGILILEDWVRQSCATVTGVLCTSIARLSLWRRRNPPSSLPRTSS
jgi:hypothetical protein